MTAIVQERLFGDWIISDENIQGDRLDATTQEYKFDVEAKGSKTIKYTSRITF